MEDDGDDKDDSKRKSRNLSEKKRRDQFNALVNDLSALISTSNRKMDKSTVLKSTIAFLKHHNEATDRSKVFEIQQDWKPSFLTNDEFTHLMLESLDGFIIVFSSTGVIFYASESITSLLGYLPADLMNMSIFDLSYELDHECLLNIFLNPKPVIEPLQTDINSSNQISFYIHLKRGGLEKVDANAYELVKFVGYFRNDVNIEVFPNNHIHSMPHILQAHPTIELDRKLIFVGTGRIQTPQLIREMSSIDPTRNEFTSKHSMEWKFLFLDHRAPPIIGYMPFEVLGTSGYDYYHFDDLDSIVACHEELMQKGEGKSCYYRFLTKGQQWIWLQTEFYVSYHQYIAKAEYVVCTHKVVSYADVIRQSKPNSCKENHQFLNMSQSTTSSVKSATVTLGDFEGPSMNQTHNLANDVANNTPMQQDGTNQSICNLSNTTSAIVNEVTATQDTINIWASNNVTAMKQQQQQQQQTLLTPQMKSSRPGSSFGNISSTSISPTVKRKRYMNNDRGNESDSTSMSEGSGTSKQSLMTHLSSTRKRHCMPHVPQQQTTHHQQQTNSMLTQLTHQAPQMTTPFHHANAHPHHHHHQQSTHHSHSTPITQAQTAQKCIPVLPPIPIATTQIVTNNTCQYTQPRAFTALRSPQIVAPTFLEPPQYLTAIPVQPVIAPFPVAPVLSPITAQPEIIPGAVVMAPTQSQLQEQLQRKHDELQKLIIQQQDELRMVSEQLLLARYTLLQPLVPVASYNSTNSPTTSMAAQIGSSNRGYSFVNSSNNAINAEFQQFGEYGINTEPMSNSSDHHQAALMHHQPRQHHQQQQQQSHHSSTTIGSTPRRDPPIRQDWRPRIESPTTESLQQQQQSHHQLQHVHQHQALQSSQDQASQVNLPLSQQQQQQHHHQQLHQSYLQRNVPELDEFVQEDIDVFLSLSPLQAMPGSESVLQQIGASSSNNNNAATVSNNNKIPSPLSHSYNVNNTNPTTVPTPNDDSLLSYMQMAAASSPTIDFQIGINDDGAETQSEDTKFIPQLSEQQQHQQQQQQQNSSYFSTNAFQALGNQTPSANAVKANQLPNELEILPYQMSQEVSQNLFNSPSNNNAGGQ